MRSIDEYRLKTTTEHIYNEVLQAKGAEANGQLEGMAGHYRSAATAACELMTEMTAREVETSSTEISEHMNTARSRKALEEPELVRGFLEAESDLLKEIGQGEG